jgi:hypothetical protein
MLMVVLSRLNEPIFGGISRCRAAIRIEKFFTLNVFLLRLWNVSHTTVLLLADTVRAVITPIRDRHEDEIGWG